MRRVAYDLEGLPEKFRANLSSNRTSLVKRNQWVFLIGILVISDFLMTNFAFQTAYQVRFELAIPLFRLEVDPSSLFYQNLSRFLGPVWVAIFAAIGLYNRQNLLGGTQEYSMVFNATSVGMFSVIAFGFLQPDFVLARGWLVMAWGFAFLFTALARFLLRRAFYAARDHGFFLTPAIIVGANDEGCSIAQQMISWKRSGLDLVGFVDDAHNPGVHVFHHVPCLGSVAQMSQIIRKYGISEVIVSSSAFSRDEVLAIFKQHGVSDQVNLSMSSGLYEIITTGLSVKEVASVPLVTVNKVRLKGADLILKLLLDYFISLTVLILAIPIFLILALAVKLDSPGPVLHRRRVMGVNGKKFDAFKFRTMYVNGAEILDARPELKAELEANHKLKNDPRVTRVGALLRKTSLDELPQLFNVLRNEMSIVGPRMISPEEMSMYSQWGINLLTVKPGITGLWQVSGRSDVSYDERVRLDMYYIRNWNIWLDLQILIETIPAVFSRRGAY